MKNKTLRLGDKDIDGACRRARKYNCPWGIPEEEKLTLNVGDLVNVGYISDCNPHNYEIAEVVVARPYKYYPNGTPDCYEMRKQIGYRFKEHHPEKYPSGHIIVFDGQLS